MACSCIDLLLGKVTRFATELLDIPPSSSIVGYRILEKSSLGLLSTVYFWKRKCSLTFFLH